MRKEGIAQPSETFADKDCPEKQCPECVCPAESDVPAAGNGRGGLTPLKQPHFCTPDVSDNEKWKSIRR